MVSKLRDAAASRARLRAAAEREFAARGFAGATVDRIAGRAGVTKAMVYYHFHNKAALYREILRDMFAAVADRVADVRAAGGPPETQLAAFVRAINETAMAEPNFPPIWLRELADGGRHIDESIVGQTARVLDTLRAILGDGHAAGTFREAPLLGVQFSIVGPLLLSAVSEPIRERYHSAMPGEPAVAIAREAIVAHVQRAALAALAPQESGRSARVRRTR